MNDNQHIPSGYKPSPLGIIPEDWEVKRLGEIGELVSGLTYSPDEISENGVLVLRSSNIKERTLVYDDCVYVNTKKYNPVHAGDILICVRNGSKDLIGKNAVIEKEVNGVAFGAFMAIFRSDLNSYIFHLFDTDYYKRSINRNLGATINSINGSDLMHFRFPIPPNTELKAIAEILKTWDTAIAKQTALIEQLTLRKRGLMQQLLTGKKRLKGFEGGTFHRLSNYISECNRRNNGCKRVLSVTNTRGFILQEEQFDKIVASNDTSNYKVVRRGEFAYNPSRVNVGSLAMLNEYDEGILSPMYIVFKANENIDKSYLLQCLQSWWFRGHIPAYTQGSVRDSLSFDGLCSMKFYIPTLQEQKAISAILEQADKEIEIQKQKLSSLQSQKRGLMQQLLTGKKRITK